MSITELRADEAAVAEDPTVEEERRLLVRLLEEGMEDTRAGRVVPASEVERRVAEAMARGAARRERQGRAV